MNGGRAPEKPDGRRPAEPGHDAAMTPRMMSDLVPSAKGLGGMSMRSGMKMAGWDHDVTLETVQTAAGLSGEARQKKTQKR